jgi:RNA polymerase primary sigma factor
MEYTDTERTYTIDQILAAIPVLNEREADILRRRFPIHRGKPESRKTIGESWGVSNNRIRQIEARAVRKLAIRLHMATLDWER